MGFFILLLILVLFVHLTFRSISIHYWWRHGFYFYLLLCLEENFYFMIWFLPFLCTTTRTMQNRKNQKNKSNSNSNINIVWNGYSKWWSLNFNNQSCGWEKEKEASRSMWSIERKQKKKKVLFMQLCFGITLGENRNCGPFIITSLPSF